MSDLRLAAMQLAAELGKVELLVVTEENRQLVTEQLAGWNESDTGISRERLERLLFVSPVPISLPKPAKVGSVHPSQDVMQILQGVGRDSFLGEHLPATDTGHQL